MDLSTLSLSELSGLQEEIKTEFKKRQRQEVARAREQIAAIAQSVGMPLNELLGTGANKSFKVRKPVPVRYRHPENPSLQWTGRGRQPQWVKDWLSGGKSMTSLNV